MAQMTEWYLEMLNDGIKRKFFYIRYPERGL